MIENPNYEYSDMTNEISIDVKPYHVPERSDPKADLYLFAYSINITNNSNQKLKLTNRHWSIRDGRKNERYINGEGVEGQRPELAPGETFNYTNFCPLNTPTGNMRGKFQFLDENGDSFWASVPLFFLRTEETFH